MKISTIPAFDHKATGRTRRRVLATAASVLGHRLFGQISLPAPAEVEQFMRRYSVPGMAIAVARGPNTLYSKCFGVANKDTHAPVTPQSLFRIASNSKAFTSAALFLLIEAGKLNLGDNVFGPGGILPEYSNLGSRRDWARAITVHHLLTHTAGGWGNESDDPMGEERGLNQKELIAWTLKTHPLHNPPGTKYAYSNFGYCVLGRIIEKLSNVPYSQFVHRRVINAAGIRDMRIGTHKPAPNEVTYYGQDGANPYDVPITRMDSHGGWIATASDMALFLASLFSPQDQEGGRPVITQASLREMTQGTAANAGYACGLAVNSAGNAWHAGMLAGTLSLMVHTHSGLSWSAVMNTSNPNSSAQPDLDRMLWRLARSVPEWKA